MKLWHIVALLGILGIAYVLIARPSLPSAGGGASSMSSNVSYSNTIGALANLTGKVLDKFGSPPDGTGLYQEGDTLDEYTTKLFGPGTEG